MLRLFIIFFLCVPAIAWADHKKGHVVPDAIKPVPEQRKKEIRSLDENQDGVLQAEELGLKAQKTFDEADTNKDGILSSKEIKASREKTKAKSMAIYDRRSTANSHATRVKRHYKNADKNDDGQVSKEEYEAYFNDRYNLFDLDGNGIITEEEYRTDTEKLPNSYYRRKKEK